MLHLGLSHLLVDDIEDCGWSVKDKGHRPEELLRYFCLLLLPDRLCDTYMGLLCLLGGCLGELGSVAIFTVFKNGGKAAQFLILKIVQW